MMEKESEEQIDNRREAAIASSASLRPNFKSNNGVTQAQLSKFQELHKRRMQIKAKSKVHKKSKAKGLVNKDEKFNKKDIEATNEEVSQAIGDSSVNVGEGNVAVASTSKRREKLYWGLDAKERWERKSNM